MDFLSLLIFDLDGARFGLDATKVRESVWLPELTPLEEAPLWVVGIFSLRGQIVPVTDLHVRFGHPARSYTPGDQVVVLETAHLPMGLIVSEVIGVVELPGTAIQPPPQFDSVANSSSHLVAGEVRVGDDLITLLDIFHLTQFPEAAIFAGAPQRPVSSSHFCMEAAPEARAVFRARAMALREISIEEDATRLGLA
ncbi:MAG: chemotaxis protein CheW, partial [Gallionellaceae bacterium]